MANDSGSGNQGQVDVDEEVRCDKRGINGVIQPDRGASGPDIA